MHLRCTAAERQTSNKMNSCMMDKIILLYFAFTTVGAQTDLTSTTSAADAQVDEVGLMPANVSEVPLGGFFSFTCAADRFRKFPYECVELIAVSKCTQEDCASASLFKDLLVVHSGDTNNTVSDLNDNVRFETSKPENLGIYCDNAGRMWAVLHVSNARSEDAGLYRCAMKPFGNLQERELIVRITLYTPRIIAPKSSGVYLKPAFLYLAFLSVALLVK